MAAFVTSPASRGNFKKTGAGRGHQATCSLRHTPLVSTARLPPIEPIIDIGLTRLVTTGKKKCWSVPNR
jgi:hypothetical protein